MEFNKHYLTSEEVMMISIEALNQENTFSRKIIMLAMIAQIVIKDLPKFDDCNKIYDYLMENQIDLYEEVFNIFDVEEIIEEETSIAKEVKKFLGDLEVRLDEYSKNLSTENMQLLIDELAKIKQE